MKAGLILFLFLLPGYAASWFIDTYSVSLSLSAEGILSVEEALRMDVAGGAPSVLHRALPRALRDPAGVSRPLAFEEISAFDGAGGELVLERRETPGAVELHVPLSPGEGDFREVRLAYRVRGALANRRGGQSLIWEAVSPEWTVPVREARLELPLPEGVDPAAVRLAAGVSRPSQDARAVVFAVENATAFFRTERYLAPRQGMEVEVFWDGEPLSVPAVFASVPRGVSALAALLLAAAALSFAALRLRRRTS